MRIEALEGERQQPRLREGLQKYANEWNPVYDCIRTRKHSDILVKILLEKRSEKIRTSGGRYLRMKGAEGAVAKFSCEARCRLATSKIK